MGNHHLERGLLVQFAKGEAHYSTEQVCSTLYTNLFLTCDIPQGIYSV